MKSCKWNTPQQISLDPSQSTVVGRLPEATYESRRVVLHSEKLPFMLSREHALLTYNHHEKKWTLTDLKVLDIILVADCRDPLPGSCYVLKTEDLCLNLSAFMDSMQCISAKL